MSTQIESLPIINNIINNVNNSSQARLPVQTQNPLYGKMILSVSPINQIVHTTISEITMLGINVTFFDENNVQHTGHISITDNTKQKNKYSVGKKLNAKIIRNDIKENRTYYDLLVVKK